MNVKDLKHPVLYAALDALLALNALNHFIARGNVSGPTITLDARELSVRLSFLHACLDRLCDVLKVIDREADRG